MKGSSILWLKHQPWIQQIYIWFLNLPQIFQEALALSQKLRSIFVWHELRKIFRISCLCCCSSQESGVQERSPKRAPPLPTIHTMFHILELSLCFTGICVTVLAQIPFRGIKLGEIISTLCLTQSPTCKEVMAMLLSSGLLDLLDFF